MDPNRSKKCDGYDCETMVFTHTDFCMTCAGEIKDEIRDGLERIDHVLQLEAEFSLWCAEHGQPDPHG